MPDKCINLTGGRASLRRNLPARRSCTRRQRYSGRETDVHHALVVPERRAGQTDDMRSNDLDISKLSQSERIQLAEDLWGSVAAETGELPLTAAQAAELDRRLADLARDSEAGEIWPVVRTRIEQRLDKAG